MPHSCIWYWWGTGPGISWLQHCYQGHITWLYLVEDFSIDLGGVYLPHQRSSGLAMPHSCMWYWYGMDPGISWLQHCYQGLGT